MIEILLNVVVVLLALLLFVILFIVLVGVMFMVLEWLLVPKEKRHITAVILEDFKDVRRRWTK